MLGGQGLGYSQGGSRQRGLLRVLGPRKVEWKLEWGAPGWRRRRRRAGWSGKWNGSALASRALVLQLWIPEIVGIPEYPGGWCRLVGTLPPARPAGARLSLCKQWSGGPEHCWWVWMVDVCLHESLRRLEAKQSQTPLPPVHRSRLPPCTPAWPAGGAWSQLLQLPQAALVRRRASRAGHRGLTRAASTHRHRSSQRSTWLRRCRTLASAWRLCCAS